MRLLGIDPGLRATGWGIVDASGNRLSHVAHGVVRSDGRQSLARRLTQIHQGLGDVVERFGPDEAAVEEVFVNRNPSSTLRLGHARGVALLAPALAGIPVSEYATNLVKKSVVGTGHATKTQIAEMVRRLLPGCVPDGSDAADALAVAICHAHHAATRSAWARAERAS